MRCVARNASKSAAARALFDAAIVRLAMSSTLRIFRASRGKADLGRSGHSLQVRDRGGHEDSKKKDQPLVDESSDPMLPLPLRERVGRGGGAAVEPSPRPSPCKGEGASPLTEIKPISDNQLWPRVLEVAQHPFLIASAQSIWCSIPLMAVCLRLSLDESGADVVRYFSNNTDKIVDLVKRRQVAMFRWSWIPVGLTWQDGGCSAASGEGGYATERPRPAIVDKALDLFDAVIVSVDQIERSAKRNPAGKTYTPLMFDQLKGMAGMAGLLRDLPRIKAKMEQVKEELGRITVEAETGGGASSGRREWPVANRLAAC